MAYQNVTVPAGGSKITMQDGKLNVPDNPIIPFIEGDGTGRDIWKASVRVFDAAVEKAYGNIGANNVEAAIRTATESWIKKVSGK